MRFIILVLLFTPFTLWADVPTCSDATCAAKIANSHEVRKIETWKGMLANTITERVGEAQDNVLDYLKWANLVDGFKSQPSAEDFPDEFPGLVFNLFSKFPKDLSAKLKAMIVGIFGVKNLGSSGFTETIHDASGKVVGAIIVLDVNMLKTKGDEWANFKEASLFKNRSPFEVKVFVDKAGEESWKTTAEFLLLHEIGHVVNLTTTMTPFWNDKPDPSWKRFPFFALSWEARDVVTAKGPNIYSFRKDLKFYKGPTMENAQIPVVYDLLAKSNFPTLYSMSGFADDFAESFAGFVREKKLGREPYKIEVRKNGQLTQTIPSCWATARCAEKAKLLETLWH